MGARGSLGAPRLPSLLRHLSGLALPSRSAFGRMFAARSATARSHQFRRRPFRCWEGRPRFPWRGFVGKSSWSLSGRRGAPRASSRSLSWPRSIENCTRRTPALSCSSRHTARSQKRGEWYGGIASLCRSCLRTQRNLRAARSTGRSSVASRRSLSRSQSMRPAGLWDIPKVAQTRRSFEHSSTEPRADPPTDNRRPRSRPGYFALRTASWIECHGHRSAFVSSRTSSRSMSTSTSQLTALPPPGSSICHSNPNSRRSKLACSSRPATSPKLTCRGRA
jgi:hypothetical protein